jgi:ParB-like chromosome segregation protein Spo0J
MVAGAHGKRPGAKLKVMAKLGENLYRTTKVFRFCESRFAGLPKPKWQAFLSKNREQRKAWQEWWNSPQSQRWKDIEKPKLKPAEDGQ